MRRETFVAPLLALCATIAFAASRPAQQPKTVHGQGCVEAGVEAGCLVVKDIRSGTVYNLLVKGVRPSLGLGIDFTGVEHEGTTMCMQGIAVDVTAWKHVDSIKCAPGHPAKP
jgi:hypothetical protein